MPYINPEKRKELSQKIEALLSAMDAGEAGTLNYVITKLVTYGLSKPYAKYAQYNSAIGVLECAKLELYRCMVAEYEDIKKVENGDVYPPSGH